MLGPKFRLIPRLGRRTAGRFFPIRLRTHRSRFLWGQWSRLVVFVGGGLAIGAAAVAIALLADWTGELFIAIRNAAPLSPLIITPLGFAVSRWATGRFVPNAGGSGIPQAIAARHLVGMPARWPLVSLRTAAGKTVLLLLGLLCGGSIGREGPTVQVGASIMFAVGRLSPRRQAGLILAGAGAGVAAAFNTPLAGIVFAIEEMSRSFEAETSGIILGAVIAAGLTAISLQGDYTYFGVTNATLHGAEGWLSVPILGLGGGLLGGVFSRVLVEVGKGLPGRVGRAIARRPILFASLCGLLVAVCGIVSGGDVFGTGYAQARALVQGTGDGSLIFGPLKMVATAASSVSGIPGGLFAPSLAVGAGLGADLAALLPSAPAQALVVLGMVAYFSGVVQAPITAFVIVAEMTNDHALVVPLMLASLIGFFSSRLVCPEGVYHALSRRYVAEGMARAQAARGQAARVIEAPTSPTPRPTA